MRFIKFLAVICLATSMVGCGKTEQDKKQEQAQANADAGNANMAETRSIEAKINAKKVYLSDMTLGEVTFTADSLSLEAMKSMNAEDLESLKTLLFSYIYYSEVVINSLNRPDVVTTILDKSVVREAYGRKHDYAIKLHGIAEQRIQVLKAVSAKKKK